MTDLGMRLVGRWPNGHRPRDHVAVARECALAAGAALGHWHADGSPAPDPWTAWAVLGHLAAPHRQGQGTPGQARRLASSVDAVSRWRKYLEVRREADDRGFDPDDHPVDLGLAADRARTWARRVPDLRGTRRYPVTRTRDGFAVGDPDGAPLSRFLQGPLWDGPDEASARGFADFLAAHDAFRDTWTGREFAVGPVATETPGVVAWATKLPGDADLLVTLERDGRRVGCFTVLPADMAACHAAGRMALSASLFLQPDFVRRGFGEAMHALCEEATGLPLVPHGLNGQGGTLNEASTRFYAKRLAQGLNVGMDEASHTRFVGTWPRTAWRAARRGLTTSEMAGVLSSLRSVVGGTPEHAVDRHGEPLKAVWLAMPDGGVLTQAGAFDRAGLLEALHRHSPRCRVVAGEAVPPHGSAVAHALADKVLAGLGLPTRSPLAPPRNRALDMTLGMRDGIVSVAEAIAAEQPDARPRWA